MLTLPLHGIESGFTDSLESAKPSHYDEIVCERLARAKMSRRPLQAIRPLDSRQSSI